MLYAFQTCEPTMNAFLPSQLTSAVTVADRIAPALAAPIPALPHLAMSKRAPRILVAIDDRVSDLAMLQACLTAEAIAIVIPHQARNRVSDRDGQGDSDRELGRDLEQNSVQDSAIEQLCNYLAEFPTVEEVAIVAHAEPGAVYWGRSRQGVPELSLAAIKSQPDVVQALQQLGRKLKRLAIYGCRAGAAVEGQAFVQRLAEIMGCAIAASSTPIGHAALGGNWKLDRVVEVVDNTHLTTTHLKTHQPINRQQTHRTAASDQLQATQPAPAVSPFRPTITTYPHILAPTADTYTISEDAVLTATAGNATFPGLLDNDGGGSVVGILDASNNPVLSTTVQGATVSVTSTGSLTFSPSASDSLQVNKVGGTIAVPLKYLHNNGSGTFTTVDITINVTGAEDASQASDRSVTLAEDSTYAFTSSNFGLSDKDTADSLQIIQITSVPPIGTLKYSGTTLSSGLLPYSINLGNIGNLTYAPPANAAGGNFASFKYKVAAVPNPTAADWSTNEASLVLTVMPGSQDDSPVAVSDSAITTPNQAVTIEVAANDYDPDGDPFQIFLPPGSTTSSKGGSISLSGTRALVYTPPKDFVGSDTFTYTLTDNTGKVTNATGTVSVIVNTAPVAVDDVIFTNVSSGLADVFPLANDFDPNGNQDKIAFNMPTPFKTLKDGTIAATGDSNRFTYTAAAKFTGADRFTYSIADQNGGVASAIVRINPTQVKNDDFRLPWNSSLILDVFANDSQYEPLSFQKFDSKGLNGGAISVESGTKLRYTPPTNFEGTDYFYYTAIDSLGNTAQALVNVLVSRLIPAPVDPSNPVAPQPELTGNEGSSVTLEPFPEPRINITVDTRGTSSATGGSAFGNIQDNALIGLDGDDVLVGFEGNDNLLGAGGNDQLFGNSGNDYIQGDAGNDLAFAGQGDDYIVGGDGNDIVAAEVGNDVINGGAGDDFLFGNQGIDRIEGGAGSDTLFGGQDNDIVTGNFGNDIISGERGNDVVVGGNEDDQLFGNNDNDILDGCVGNDTLYGGKNEDVLYGGDGVDLLLGDQGYDTLNGGVGNDILNGGAELDELTGSAGADSFIVERNGFADVITDFEVGVDKLVLTNTGLAADTISVVANGNSTVIQVFGISENLVTLTGITAASVTLADFVFQS